MRTRRVVLALVVLVSLTVVATVSAHDDDDDHRELDVRVAKRSNGKCGKPANSLPGLISRSGVRPGDVVGDFTVCVTNSGHDAGVLSLRVTELVDLDVDCTGAEASGDTTCGDWKRGELGQMLLQQVGLAGCPTVPATTDAKLDRRLPALQAGPLVLLGRLRRKQVACVRLRLRYEPFDAGGGTASQSDRTMWRYAFSLTELR